MAELKHVWTNNNVFQAGGTTVHWTWKVGEDEHYWGFCVRPRQFNSDAEIVQQFTTSDNGNAWFENLIVRTNTGNLFRFSAIAVVGS
ncbi:hypothetical protein AB4Y96_09190 [Phyllobacterium sp. TAF24]|uniref:hypothetical protein n=1 Tax=Phyllobacterium sp. TAF24 TaxID=3233068 RepID=UPI003F9C5897